MLQEVGSKEACFDEGNALNSVESGLGLKDSRLHPELNESLLPNSLRVCGKSRRRHNNSSQVPTVKLGLDAELGICRPQVLAKLLPVGGMAIEETVLGKAVKKHEHELFGVLDKPRTCVEVVGAAVEEVIVLVKEGETCFRRLTVGVASEGFVFENLREAGEFVESRKMIGVVVDDDGVGVGQISVHFHRHQAVRNNCIHFVNKSQRAFALKTLSCK